jgi:hypothetical protein
MQSELGRHLPSRTLREYYYDLSHLIRREQSIRVPMRQAQQYYIDLELTEGRQPDPATITT